MKRKQRFDSLQRSKEHYQKYLKETHWRSVVSEIQSFITVKDVCSIVAGYAVETEFMLRCTRTKKELVDVLTGNVEFKWSSGVPFNSKTICAKELNGVFVQDKNRYFFMQAKDARHYGVGRSWKAKGSRDMAYHGLSQSLIVAWILPKTLILDLVLRNKGNGNQFILSNRCRVLRTKDRFQMIILNGNVVVITGDENEDNIIINVWSVDLKKKLITDKTVLSQNWPLILENDIICSSSEHHYDQFYHFQEDGSFQRVFQNDIFMHVQYRFAGSNVYKIDTDLTCVPMTLHDPELNDNFTIHSVQRTQCGVFIIGMFQRGISLEFSYRCYCEWKGQLYKRYDKQDLFDSKITHCLLLT
jgi:hypothetical protein